MCGPFYTPRTGQRRTPGSPVAWRGPAVPRPFSQELGTSYCLMAGRLLPSLGHLASRPGLSLEPVVTLLLPPSLAHVSPKAAAVGGCQGGLASTFHRG